MKTSSGGVRAMLRSRTAVGCGWETAEAIAHLAIAHRRAGSPIAADTKYAMRKVQQADPTDQRDDRRCTR